MELELSQLTDLKTMLFVAFAMSIIWGIILEVSKGMLYAALPSTSWWDRAIRPTTQMMQNFGYPKVKTDKFPDAVSEPMARDFYAYLTTLCGQHFLSALPMVPVVYYGWDNVSEMTRCWFVLGTMSDLGFDFYDSAKFTIRTFTPGHKSPVPVDFWIVIVALHHTLAMSLVIPMNLFYIHLPEYQQTVVSLLLAASICYSLGNYKFILDVKTTSGFYKYKAAVLFQLTIILYTRVYLWFPAMLSMHRTFREQEDTIFVIGGGIMGFIFSVFNLLLVADGMKAAVKWLPRSKPTTTHEINECDNDVHDGYGSAPATAFGLVSRMRRRKLKGAVHSVIALNRMKMLKKMA